VGDLQVLIEDDGKALTHLLQPRGLAFPIILSRVNQYNGKISIESTLGNGCKIDISIPL
jgi:signal transduction histidine kinase